MNFMKIAWRDISSIFKNRFIRVSVTAIIIVPLLYSMLYLYAFWDPYSKLADMPVAIVNLDKGSENGSDKVNYGNDLVDNLKKNEKVGWRFVSEKEAEDGVKGNSYYAMFVIPEDFSKNILSAKDGKPQQASILYTANEKKNFLAAQINGKVLLEIKSELVKNITDEYTKVTFDNLYDLKDGMQQAADGSKSVKDGIVKAHDASQEITNGMGQLRANIPQMKDGVGQLYAGSGDLNNGISTAANGIKQLYDGSLQLNYGLKDLNTKAPGLKNGVDNLYQGSLQLKGGMSDAMNGAASLSTGIDKFNNEALTPVSSGVTSLYGSFNQKIFPGINSLKDGANSLASGLNQDTMTAAVNQLTQGAQGLNNGLTMQGGLNDGAKSLSDGAAQIQGGAPQLSTALTSLNEGAAGVASGINTLVNNMNSSQAELQNAVNTKLSEFLKNNPTATQDPNMVDFLATLNDLQTKAQSTDTQTQVAQLQAGAQALVDGTSQLKTQSQALINGISQFAAGAQQFTTGASQFTAGAQQFSGGANSLTSGLTNAMTGSKTLSDGLNDLYNGSVVFNGGLKQLNDNMPLVQGAALKLKTEGTDKLYNGLSALNDGALKLTGGLNYMQSQMPDLVKGTSDLYNGSTQLTNGLGSSEDSNALVQRGLVSGTNTESTDTLMGGLVKLYDGSSQLKSGLGSLNSQVPGLQDGTNQLFDGASKLTDGLVQLSDGSKELNDKLTDGSDKLNKSLVNDSKTMANFVSDPLKMDEQPINPVKNYGTGFAPYFIPLSLWVGAIMMFFVITAKVDDDIEARSGSIVVGKYLSYGFIGILQAILASTVVIILGLRPDNVVMYYLFNIFMSLVFIAIIQSLIFLLGDAGRLLAIVLLILQLTSCAGTFPLEVVPNFFKVINPYMPFTYCVSALRETISGMNYSVFAKDVSILAVVMVVFVVISIIMKGHADRMQEIIRERKETVTA